MAAPDPALALTGPAQRCQGCIGQYVYWIVMPYPLPDIVARTQIKTPDEFTRDSFRDLLVRVHIDCEVPVVETVCVKEPHANKIQEEQCPQSAATATCVEKHAQVQARCSTFPIRNRLW